MSTLLEIRTEFINRSGRFDLVIDTDDYLDDGADFFINAGLRHLEARQQSPQSVGSFREDIAISAYKLNMKWCRSIESVWISKYRLFL